MSIFKKNPPDYSLRFSYSDLYFDFAVEKETIFNIRQGYNSLLYVYSGKITVNNTKNDKVENANEGDCLFINQNVPISISCVPNDNGHFECLQFIIKDKIPKITQWRIYSLFYYICNNIINKDIVKLPHTQEIKSLFISMIPYFSSPIMPCKEVMSLKQKEALYSLLYANKSSHIVI